MADIWPINMKADDKPAVEALAARRGLLGLDKSYAGTIRAAVKLAASASDEDLKVGELL